jgi:glutamyl-tRNA reductase
VNGFAVPWTEMIPALGTADIVITATGASRPIITRAHVEAVTRRRAGPLYIIDLAVPRDVEPSVGDIEQVFLYNIDDLQKFVQKNLSSRSAEIELGGGDRRRRGRALSRAPAFAQCGAGHQGVAQALLRGP